MAPGGFWPIKQLTLFSVPCACLSEASETSPGHYTEPPLSLSACLDPSLLSVRCHFVFILGLFTG